MKYVQIRKTSEVVAVETDNDDVAKQTATEWALGRPPMDANERYGTAAIYRMTVLTPSTGIKERRL